MSSTHPIAASALAAGALALLAGCAAPAIHDNVAAARAEVGARGGPDFVWLSDDAARDQARTDVAQALRQPLTADAAVRVALANDPALQAQLFDTGDATREAARARYDAALARSAAQGVAAASQLRQADGDRRDAHALAPAFRDRLVPLQATILGQDLLRYNGMLASPFDVTPGASVPRTSTRTDFNLRSWNSRIFRGIAPLVARQHERARIRVGNLSMTNHPIHLHGHEMQVTGTDGGPTPPASRWPEVTVDIAVGQMRQLEFVAEAEGDWSLHCHKSHHTMNAMSHDVPNMIGVDQKDVVEKIRALVPGYMAMGGNGMGDMTDMAMMPGPPNTAPMMGGDGPYGSLEMGGMFSVVKVRRDQPAGDYRDPGW